MGYVRLCLEDSFFLLSLCLFLVFVSLRFCVSTVFSADKDFYIAYPAAAGVKRTASTTLWRHVWLSARNMKISADLVGLEGIETLYCLSADVAL